MYNNSLSELEVIAREIDMWLNSEKRLNMIIGEKYYLGEHDILKEPRTAIGEDGELVEVKNLPDNRIVDNQYAKMVDQKSNYIVGKPFTIECENDDYATKLEREVFNFNFMRIFRNLAVDSLNYGISWLYPYYDEFGELRFKRFKSYEILPFWKDSEHTILDFVCRVYDIDMYEGSRLVTKTKVELYRSSGIYRYDFIKKIDGYSKLVIDTDFGNSPYFSIEGQSYSWNDRVPVIPFKYNHREVPLIVRVKSIQDAINRIMSNFTNNTLEDSRNTIIVIHNYDGEDLGKFRRNLATYGAVKVRSGEGLNGGVETLTIEVNAENYKTILRELKLALIENARGFDAKSDKLMGNPNQMNIQSMYSDIDLDSNGMEIEFQASLEQLMYFINYHTKVNTLVDFTFNRDILMNNSEVVKSINESLEKGSISRRTASERNPYSSNDELERIEEERNNLDTEVEQFMSGLGDNLVE